MAYNRSATAVAPALGIAQSSASAWVRQAEAAPSASVSLREPARRELAALRREVRVLCTARDRLKRAAAFFAKEQV